MGKRNGRVERLVQDLLIRYKRAQEPEGGLLPHNPAGKIDRASID